MIYAASERFLEKINYQTTSECQVPWTLHLYKYKGNGGNLQISEKRREDITDWDLTSY